MSLSDLASLGSFVSGVAILVSLIFLTVQMRQNTEAVRAATSHAHQNALFDIAGLIAEHDDTAEVFRIGFTGLEPLSDNQRTRFLVVMTSIVRYWQDSWLERERGHLDTGLWYTVEVMVRDIVKQPGFPEFWSMRSHWFTPEFRAWIDALPKLRPERGLYDLPPKPGDARSSQTLPA